METDTFATDFSSPSISTSILRDSAAAGVSVDELADMYRLEQSNLACRLAFAGDAGRLRWCVSRHTVDASHQGWTPLMMAAAAPGDRGLACGRHLLLLGADPEFADSGGRTAGHYAALGNNAKMLRMLQQHSQLDSVTRLGQTPLMLAACVNSAEAVKILSSSQRQTQARDFRGNSAFELARKFHSWAAAMELATDAAGHAEFTWKERRRIVEMERSSHRICRLCHSGDAKSLQSLLSASNCNSRWQSHPAVWWASAAGQNSGSACLSLLLEAGADADAADWEGGRAAHAAAVAGNWKILQKLHRHVGIDEPDSDGWTPLALAASAGHSRTVAELLKLGAMATSRDSDGNLALAHAEAGGHWRVAAQLLRSLEPD